MPMMAQHSWLRRSTCPAPAAGSGSLLLPAALPCVAECSHNHCWISAPTSSPRAGFPAGRAAPCPPFPLLAAVGTGLCTPYAHLGSVVPSKHDSHRLCASCSIPCVGCCGPHQPLQSKNWGWSCARTSPLLSDIVPLSCWHHLCFPTKNSFSSLHVL